MRIAAKEERLKGGNIMADERDKTYNKDFQQARKDGHMTDPTKNKEAWGQKAQDAAGRDWTKPRRWDPSQGV